MPNWCENILKVTGSQVELKDFAKKAAGQEDRMISFASFIPTPKKPPETTDWYYKNWGTKWDASDAPKYIPDANPEKRWAGYGVYFTTAWSPPTPVIVTMSKQFPQLTFTHRYYEGGECYAGEVTYKAGLTLKESDYNLMINELDYKKFRDKYFYEED